MLHFQYLNQCSFSCGTAAFGVWLLAFFPALIVISKFEKQLQKSQAF